MNRREILSGAAAMVSSASAATAKPMIPIPPGIKIGVSANTPSPEHMAYLKQLGRGGLHCAEGRMGKGGVRGL
jgi:hypothetical protein